jgi:hypothetical protein
MSVFKSELAWLWKEITSGEHNITMTVTFLIVWLDGIAFSLMFL